ncbi:hypothetical protein CUMW_228120, partial [Citrus unshiu]
MAYATNVIPVEILECEVTDFIDVNESWYWSRFEQLSLEVDLDLERPSEHASFLVACFSYRLRLSWLNGIYPSRLVVTVVGLCVKMLFMLYVIVLWLCINDKVFLILDLIVGYTRIWLMTVGWGMFQVGLFSLVLLYGGFGFGEINFSLTKR